MGDPAVVTDIDETHRVELLAVDDLDQLHHTVVPDQRAIRQPAIVAQAHQGRVGDIAPRVYLDVGPGGVKPPPARQVRAPLDSVGAAQAPVQSGPTSGGHGVMRHDFSQPSHHAVALANLSMSNRTQAARSSHGTCPISAAARHPQVAGALPHPSGELSRLRLHLCVQMVRQPQGELQKRHRRIARPALGENAAASDIQIVCAEHLAVGSTTPASGEAAMRVVPMWCAWGDIFRAGTCRGRSRST